jgi:hypothetical protein
MKAMNRPSITAPRFFVMEGDTAHAFDVEKCDECGCDCEAANAFNIHEPKAKLLSLGMKELPARLPETGYCDALSAVVCPGCYVEEPGE